MTEETTTKPGIEEFTESLTGFDEIAIEKAFKVPGWTDLPAGKMTRALAFIMFRRSGSSDTDAYQRCMEASIGAINDMFDIPEGDDESEAVGKDDTPPE